MPQTVQKQQRTKTFFRGVLRTSRGSVILVAVENMPIAPTGVFTLATNAAYGRPTEPQEHGAGVGQSIYIGQQYDAATQLLYANARYYNGSQGQFLSEDPMFLGDQSQQNLADPQSLNAYSYSEDNPITKSDPKGLQVALGLDDLAAYGIIATSPIWIPIVYRATNALSTAVMGSFTDSWARSNSRQIQNVNINSEFDEGGMLPNNKEPKDDWKTKAALLGLTGIGLAGTVYQGYQDFANSTPAISVGTAGGGNVNTFNNLNQGQLYYSNPNSTIKSPPQGSTPTGSSNQGGGSAGFSQQQLQNIQNTLSQIQQIVNQIQNIINSSKK